MTQRWPWDQTHELTVAEMPQPAPFPGVVPLADTVRLLQKDMAYAVTHTAVLVHSPHASLQMLVNTARGQSIPKGECILTDGTALEFQDIGMPQPGAPAMTVTDLALRVWGIVTELGLGLKS